MNDVGRSPLNRRARQAGARFSIRGSSEVASGYGPVAAEIAACRASAGISDRSYVAKLDLRAPAEALAAAIAEHAGAVPEPGAALHREGVWWCLPEAGRALALATRAADGPPREQLETALEPEGGTVADVTAALAAIELTGPRATELLDSVTEAPLDLQEGRLAAGLAAGVEVTVLRERPDGILLLCEAGAAERLWDSLSEAGRPLGAAHVGVDALERLEAAPASASAPN
jgi:aminomethyltransferase